MPDCDILDQNGLLNLFADNETLNITARDMRSFVCSVFALLSHVSLQYETTTGLSSQDWTLGFEPNYPLLVWKNGVLLKQNLDYTCSGQVITFVNSVNSYDEYATLYDI